MEEGGVFSRGTGFLVSRSTDRDLGKLGKLGGIIVPAIKIQSSLCETTSPLPSSFPSFDRPISPDLSFSSSPYRAIKIRLTLDYSFPWRGNLARITDITRSA